MNFGPHRGRRGWVLGGFGLRACDFGAGSSIDLLAVRSLFSLFSFHLAKLATREVIAAITMDPSRPRRNLSPHFDTQPDQSVLCAPSLSIWNRKYPEEKSCLPIRPREETF